MNRIYIVVLLLVFSMQLRSQILISTPYNGNQTYDMAAPEYVRILPGFQYVPQSANYFRAYIDPNAYLTNDYEEDEEDLENRIFDYSLPVGSTKSMSDVSLLGGASFSIPIFCPPGTAGMQPSVSIVYNSQSGNGVAGYGWSISGLSSISRVPQNQYFDEKSKGINFNNDDRLAIDGQRLVLVTGANFQQSSEYLTEVFNGTKVTVKTESGYLWFEVETKDNRILEYGRTDDSRIYANIDGVQKVISWNINKITDSKTNYINFKYIRDNTNPEEAKIMNYRISEIEYTGNSNNELTPYNKIQFIYTNQRTDITQNYILGIEVYNNAMLKQINVISENSLVHKYELSHFLDRYSFLSKVTETGSDASKLNYTGFNYGPTSEKRINHEWIMSPQENNLCSEVTKYEYQYADYNGDGYTDILRIGLNICDAAHPFVLNYLLRINTTATNGSDYTGEPTFTTLFNSDFSSFASGDVVRSVTFADINGDGRSDILELHEIGPISSPIYNGECLFSKPSINNNTNRSVIFSGVGGAILPTINAIEINGDGLADLILNKLCYDGSQYNWKPELLISDHTTNAANFYTTAYKPAINLNFAVTTDPKYLKFGDFDGDGFTDILYIAGNQAFKFYKYNGTTFVQSFSTIENLHCDNVYLGDFNGDRNTDLLYSNKEWTQSIQLFDPETGQPRINPITGGFIYEEIVHPLEWHLKYSTGKSFFEGTCPINENDPDAHKFLPGDYNSDGVTDIMQITNDNVTIKMRLFSQVGDEFTSEDLTPDAGSESDFANINTWEYTLVDFNGDGQPDVASVLNVSKSEWQGYIHILWANLITSYIYPNNTKKLLHKISDGINNKQKYEYLPFTNPTVSSKLLNPDNLITSTMGDVVPVTLPLKVVNKSFNSNGINGFFEKRYNYEQLLMHRKGKGVLGPKSFTVTNVTTGMNVKSIYNIVAEPSKERFISYLLEENQSYCNSLILSKTTSNYSLRFIQYGAANSKDRIYKAYAYESFSHNYVNNIHTKTNTNSVNVDDFGNIKKKTTYYLDDNGDYASNWDEVENNLISANTWFIWKPTTTTTKSKRANDPDGKTYTQTTKVLYYPSCPENCNNAGLVLSVTDFFGTAKSLTEQYTYDEWGNIETTTISSPDPYVETATNTVGYEAKGRFVSSTTNPLGHTQLINTNKLGLTTFTTDPNSLKLSYSYDGFGNLVETTYPDNRTSTILRKWREPNDPEYVVYKIENTVTGLPLSVTYFDLLGRVNRKSVRSYEGRMKNVDNNYNAKGELSKVTDPYFDDQPLPTDDHSIRYSYYLDGRTENIYYPEFYEHYPYYYNSATREISVERFNNNGTTANIFKKARLNFLGQTVASIDIAGEIDYTYYGNGLVHTIKGVDGSITETTYDDYNRQDKLKDPNAGTIDYDYNAYGLLLKQTDANNVEIETTYDKLGRTHQISSSSGNTITYYYDAPGKPLGTLSKETHSNGTQYEYFYNDKSRLSSKTETIDGTAYTTSYTYNSLCGEIETETYPSGFLVRNEYTNDGYLKNVYKNNDPIPMIDLPLASTTYNQRGQLTGYNLGNGMKVNIFFDAYGKSTGVKYGNAMQLAWQFDPVLGNLQWRKDITNPASPLIENFTYTDITKSRLNDYQVTGQQANSVLYEVNGSIKTKSDAGTYNYNDPLHVHAVTSITAPSNVPADKFQDIRFTDFGYADQIIHRDDNSQKYRLGITYGPDYSRVKTELYKNESSQPIKTKYFVSGDYEVEMLDDGSWRELHYIAGPAGLIGIYEIKSNAEENMYYIHTDHLGSWKCITNNAAQVIEKMDFDPWGRRRNANNWSYTNVPTSFLFDRGYTGHEMLDAFVLINMNGRIYDPIVARFLSPDNYVQAPDNTQGLNRYSYCLNNPLIYTDPSGELFWVFVNGSYSKASGLDINVTVGTGVPGVLSAQATVGYNFGSDNAYITVSGSAAFATAYVGYGTQSGFYAGVSVGLALDAGNISTNMASAGISWSQRGGLSYNAFGVQFGPNGNWSADPSIGYSVSKTWERKEGQGNIALADGTPIMVIPDKDGKGILIIAILESGPVIIADRQYIINNGKKVYWDEVETGVKNYYSSQIVTVTKVKMSDAATKEFFNDMKGIHSSISSKTGWLSYSVGLSGALSKVFGIAGFTYMQLISQVQSSISEEFDTALTKYNRQNEIKHGLWLVTTHSTTISAGLVAHSSTFEFYTPNGQPFYTITY